MGITRVYRPYFLPKATMSLSSPELKVGPSKLKKLNKECSGRRFLGTAQMLRVRKGGCVGVDRVPRQLDPASMIRYRYHVFSGGFPGVWVKP